MSKFRALRVVMRCLICTLTLFLLMTILPEAQADEVVVRACGGDAEWVPSSFFQRSHGVKGAQVVGYSPDVLRAALAGKGYRVEVELLPWVRCLKEVEAGKRLHIVMALIFSPNRTREYQFTETYQTFHPGYFYWRERPPADLPLTSAVTLAKYKVCGLHGFNYAYSGLAADSIDTGAVNYTSLALKLAAGHCGIGLEMQEVLSGHLRLGEIGVPRNALVWAPLPEVAPVTAAFGVSRRMPGGDKLVADLNAGIQQLRAAGQLERLLLRYTDLEKLR